MTIQEIDDVVEHEVTECDCWRCSGVCTECWGEGEDGGCPICGEWSE